MQKADDDNRLVETHRGHADMPERSSRPSRTVSRSTLQGFAATVYRVWLEIDPGAGDRARPLDPVDVRIDRPTRALDALAGPAAWMILSADNPGAAATRPEDNAVARERLDRRLNAGGWRILGTTRHRDPSGKWPDELGRVIALDAARCSQRNAIELAGAFGQLGVVVGSTDRPATVRLLTSPAAPLPDHVEGPDP